ncbi:MAG: transporter [Candidatus Zipacnadales bacterium]
MWLLFSLIGLASGVNATPWFTQDPRTLPQGRWRVEQHLIYCDIDEGLADGQRVPLPGGVTEASALTLHTRVRYGVANDLTLFVDVPFEQRRIHTTAGTDEYSSLGDLTFLAKWKYRENREAGERQALALFATLPMGHYKGLPGLLATGSGQHNIGIIHLWEWRMLEATWYANTGYMWRTQRTDTDTKPGEVALFNLAAEHSLGSTALNFVWEINGRYAGHTTGPSGPVMGTSSTVISFSPGFQYHQQRGHTSLDWEAGIQIPVVTSGGVSALPDYTIYAGGYVIF